VPLYASSRIGGSNGKKYQKIAKRPENSTIKPLSTISVLCMKIQWRGTDSPAPATDAHATEAIYHYRCNTISSASLPVIFRFKSKILFFVLFHLYPHVTRKRRWRYILDDNPHPLRSCPFPSLPFDFLPLNLLLVRSHQAEIIMESALSKDTTTCAMRVRVEPRSRDCDHTVAIKTAL